MTNLQKKVIKNRSNLWSLSIVPSIPFAKKKYIPCNPRYSLPMREWSPLWIQHEEVQIWEARQSFLNNTKRIGCHLLSKMTTDPNEIQPYCTSSFCFSVLALSIFVCLNLLILGISNDLFHFSLFLNYRFLLSVKIREFQLSLLTPKQPFLILIFLSFCALQKEL